MSEDDRIEADGYDPVFNRAPDPIDLDRMIDDLALLYENVDFRIGPNGILIERMEAAYPASSDSGIGGCSELSVSTCLNVIHGITFRIVLAYIQK